MAEKKERFVVLLRKKVDGDGFRVKCANGDIFQFK